MSFTANLQKNRPALPPANSQPGLRLPSPARVTERLPVRFVPEQRRVASMGDDVVGLLGGTFWGWLYINLFWRAEPIRHQGVGGRILQMAEQVYALRPPSSTNVAPVIKLLASLAR